MAVVLAFLLVSAPALAQPLGQEEAGGDGSSLFAETFDFAWRLIRDTHFDPELNGLDWEAVRDELRPRAAAARSEQELRATLQEMLARLGQSHFALLPRPGAGAAGPSSPAAGDRLGVADARAPEERGHRPAGEEECQELLTDRVLDLLETGGGGLAAADPGLEVRAVQGAVLVTRVDPGSAAELAGVRPGLELVRVDGQPVRGLERCVGAGVAESVVLSLLGGDPGSRVAVELEDADAGRRRYRLGRELPVDAERVRFGNLPPLAARLESEWIETKGRRIACVRFNIWMLPIATRFETAVASMREADGFVIDLRGNPGGVAALAQGIAGYFVDERLSLGTMKSRRDELELFINPRRVLRSGERFTPYTGPLAILIDPLTASTSEIFAAGLKDHGRARLFGEPTAGAALPAQAQRLPNGDVLMHATGDFVRPGGARIEGRPVEPDEEVPLRRAALLAGRDEPLESALRWIVEEAAAAELRVAVAIGRHQPDEGSSGEDFP